MYINYDILCVKFGFNTVSCWKTISENLTVAG